MVFTFPGFFFSASKLYNLNSRFFRMLSQNTVDPLLFLFALFKILLLLLSPQSHITETYLESNLIGGISLFLPNTVHAKNTANAKKSLVLPIRDNRIESRESPAEFYSDTTLLSTLNIDATAVVLEVGYHMSAFGFGCHPYGHSGSLYHRRPTFSSNSHKFSTGN